ncbi:LytTR family DNA-binding domain-containing protein [Pedobacter sp. KR3-3]|uniref:LytTR family DNA-binding domain-containing protein n=1 Tax=Pedobacter albus TaxID=3113905 RepID=A0ABU7IAK1_9SPHI|nr:LytTR family DNA-binding domain-containing protein [Pedobacter sp. KR3-3]MEE1946387.1 LytTR family DNA-binding domain-containing protein [Pedobacter sp. KR3-3]
MTSYIIDDDQHVINAIIKHIEQIPYLTVTGHHTNPLLALNEISKGEKPDIVFLDVEMPELSGIDVIDMLDKSISVVFITSHSKYALQAFQKDVIDFLLKPFSFEQFLKCISKIQGKIASKYNEQKEINRTHLFVNPGLKGKAIQIELAEVTHIEAIEHSACIYLTNEKVIINMSIKKIQEKLPIKTFIRVHRAYIVNIRIIKMLEANLITLKNGIQIPLGEAYRNELMKQIQE